jgi:hypothetical protein
MARRLRNQRASIRLATKQPRSLWTLHAVGASWLDTFPFDDIVGQQSSKETILFVDVGSALGHQSLLLRERFPSLPGRVIIQDQKQVIDMAQPSNDIEAQVYDFFTPQPVKGM